MATLARTWQRFTHNDQLLLFLLAVAVGAAGGYGALAFRMATGGIQYLFFGDGSEQIASAARALSWWHVVAAPTLGGLLIGLFTRYVLPGKLPQGVPQVMEAAALKNGRMSLREGIAAAFVSAGSLGCGGSVGREGPIVHLGASLASAVARFLHLSPSLARTLLGCGVATVVHLLSPDKIVLGGGLVEAMPVLYLETVRRSAMDYADIAELKAHASWEAFQTSPERTGGRLLLLTTKADAPYYGFAFAPQDILMVGRETVGVPETVHAAADARLTIPMGAGARSMNVATAAALVLGEALRQTRWRHANEADRT